MVTRDFAEVNRIEVRDVLRELKLELLYFVSGAIFATLSLWAGPLSVALFWTGTCLLALGWIAIGIKIRALIHLRRIEVLKEVMVENVEGSAKREDGRANEGN